MMVKLFFMLAAGLLPSVAMAHTGVGETTGFLAGLVHPLSGTDHLLAMLAVGLWAAQTGGRAVWVIPAAFVSLMLAGAALGIAGLPVPFVEQGILASVLILGLLIAGACRLTVMTGVLIVGSFAIFHGHAHGAEMPFASGALSYCLGFALTTALLHVGGIIGGLTMKAFSNEKVTRVAGLAITLGGVYLAAYA
jgi:urease accessory protein